MTEIDSERPTMWESTAHHEAGHAVAAVTLNITFDHVMMSAYILTSQQGSNLGGVVFDKGHSDWLTDFDPGNPAHREAAENRVVLALAGEASESFLEERECDILRPSAEGDYEFAMRHAKLLHADQSACDALIEGQKRVACNMVREPLRQRQIGAVANHLRVKRELAYAEVVRIMEEMKRALEDSGFDIRDNE